MNPDILAPGERLRLDSNRNSRVARGAAGAPTWCHRKMAAAAAIEGHFVDIRAWS